MSNDSESSTASSADLKGSNKLSSSSSSSGGKSRGPGRPKKVSSSSACTWCADNKVPLKFIINQACNQKEFCSESCVAEFRNAYRKGACLVCDNVIRENAPHRDYCSSFCLNRDEEMKGQPNGTAAEAATAAESSSGATTAVTSKASNNNNTNAENLNSSSVQIRLSPYRSGGGGGSGIFQYEQLNVFDWNVYLKVSPFLIYYVAIHTLTLSRPLLCRRTTACPLRLNALSKPPRHRSTTSCWA